MADTDFCYVYEHEHVHHNWNINWIFDFISGDTEEEGDSQTDEPKKGGISKGDKSHLIVWQVFINK